MKKRWPLLPLLALLASFALLGASAAHAQPVRVEVVPASSTWQQRKRVNVTLKVTNVSGAEVKFEVMSCSWDEHWASSDHELKWDRWGCDKNAPSTVTLASGQTREWKLSMFAMQDARPGAHPLAMTFTPRGGLTTRSSAVTITVTR
jgi:hypothetical protein